ncbi:sensor histidine kinase [Saccharopolyspora gloriosae]|uniref:sensor histidine kinase n=1 Tax=Saccharopolyspora gloriosae TaxID=455344 RepID=UPI001FB6C9E7|nr:histidine kinase [Saccharopolyspora gloriosae]
MVTTDAAPRIDEARVRRAHRVLFWVTLTTAVLGAAFGYLVLSEDPAPPGGLVPSLLVGAVVQLAATVVIGRSGARPQLGLLVVLAVAALMLLLDTPWQPLMVAGGVLWVPLALSWSAARVAEWPNARWKLAVSAAAVLAYAFLAGAQPGSMGLGSALAAIAPALGGIATVLARRLGQARRDRAEALARERVAVARQEQAAERERLSADMHDNLGHVLTLLVLHANALAVSSSDPEAREAGRRIGELGGSGMTEMRRLLALLDDPDSVSGRPGAEVAESVADLVEQVREAGQAVEFTDTGAERGLPAVLARTVHRVVQEGLTNARRHAPGSTAEVSVRGADDAVRVSVRNGPGGSGEPGAGRGLDGLRRRVELLGGEVRAEVDEDGGFTLHATLPAETRS